MLIRVKKTSDPAAGDITPESVYVNRRQFIAAAGAALGTVVIGDVKAGDARPLLTSRPATGCRCARAIKSWGPRTR